MQHTKTAVIIVSFNRFDVTNLLLDSLVKATNKNKFEVFLIDNHSNYVEWEKIERLFTHLCESGALKGKSVRTRANCGFSAGNNIGLGLGLSDPEITHICLLNNDTVVTDHWLDDLIKAAGENALVGPVSNSVGNEQVVPVQYKESESNGYAVDSVRSFAREWRKNHSFQTFSTEMLGFFCVLGSREVFEKVGPLDERFGIGTFEDDDYCLRCRKLDIKLLIARHVFIHHWGSASFGRLPSAKMRRLTQKNKKLFESIHGVKWKSPSNTLPISFSQEIHSANSYLANKLEPLFIERIMAQISAGDEERRKWAGVSLTQLLYLYFRNRLGFLKGALPSQLYKTIRAAKKLLFAPLEEKRKIASKCIKVLGKFGRRLGLVFKHLYFYYFKRCLSLRNSPVILIFPICEFESRQQRPQHLARELARMGNHVIWIDPNSPRHRVGLPLSILVSKSSPLGSGRLSTVAVGHINYHNFYCTGLSLSEALETSKVLEPLLPTKGATVLVQSPFWAELAKEAKVGFRCNVRLVFDCMDDHAAFGSSTVEVEMLENLLINQADALIASSERIKKSLTNKASANSELHLVRNGVELSNFEQFRKALASPGLQLTVGYFGAIAEWFDIDLVCEVAQLLPHIRFELIGDHHLLKYDLHKVPSNIVFLGEKKYSALPELTFHWSAALIPFRLTPLILATNPVKMYEYSALGLPIVTTPIPEVIESGLNIFVGENSDEFSKALMQAVNSNNDLTIRERRAFAERNTWRQRAAEMNRAIGTAKNWGNAEC